MSEFSSFSVREFGILGLAESGSCGVIIAVVELLSKSICGIDETRLSLYGKKSHNLN